MSSDEDSDDHHGLNGGSPKRRKITSRACDRCRRKKVRCDAVDQAGPRCSHCMAARLDCTFRETAKKRAPPKGYIEDLEKRCDALEKLVARIAPHINIAEEVGPSFTQDTWSTVKSVIPSIIPKSTFSGERSSGSPAAVLPPSPTISPAYYPNKPPTNPPPLPPGLDDAESSDNDVVQGDSNNFIMKPLESRLSEMNLTGFQKRFHGKSSGVFLVQAAMSLKEEIDGKPGSGPLELNTMRMRYWKPNHWEYMYSDLPNPAKLKYPPLDLAEELVDHAFSKVLYLFPMIHRPTFDSLRKSNLQMKSVSFARLYLMVCAVGSRFSDDERACLKGEDGEVYWSSAGWDYFSQVLNMRWPILAPAGQSDLQVMGLMSIYLQSTSTPHASWLVVGIALRAAQDIGLHRERIYPADNAFDSQMWKRIFWSLVSIDRMTSTGFGRPVAIFDEDIDTELPLEVDDEYWNEEKKEWKQPDNKPSRMTAINHHIKLMCILTRAIRSIYSINKHKVHYGYLGEEWESSTVADLDSELNSWLNSLPDHLKWSPQIEDDGFFQQAALLRIMYHWVQITIHRPFIPAIAIDGKVSSLSFPSLAICTNAARAASHVIGEYVKRGFEGSPMTHLVAFTIGVILLISIWAVKKSGLNVDFAKQAEDVQSCMTFLRKGERTWHAAGKFCDILTQLASKHNVPLSTVSSPSSEPGPSKKRSREEDPEKTSTTQSSTACSVPSSLSSWSAYTSVTPPQVPATVDSSSTFTFQSLFKSPPSNMPLNLAPTSFPAFTGSEVPPLPNAQGPWSAAPPMRGAAYPAENIGAPIGNTNTSANMFDPMLNPQSSETPAGLFQDFLGVFGDANVPQARTADLSGFFGFQGGTDDWSWLNDMLGGAPQGTRGPDNPPPNF